MYTNTEIDNLLANADVATYKCASKRAKDKVRKNIDIFRNLRLIYMVKSSLYWAKDFYIGTTSLDSVANYLFTLIQPLIGQSIAALGRVLSIGGDLSAITFAPRRLQIKVGAPNSLVADGGQTLVLNYKNILPDSVTVNIVEGGELPIGDNDRFGISTIDYGKESTTITFTQALGADQEYIIRFMVGLLAADSGSSGGASLPAQSGNEGEVLMTDGTTDFWGSTVIPITSSNFESDGVTCNIPSIAKNKFIIFWNDAPTMLIEGTDFTRLENGGFKVIREGFDASINEYNLFIFLMGLNGEA